MPDGTSVNLCRWMALVGKRFRLADAVRDFDPDHILNDSGGEKIEVLCPFDENHSEEGKTGFFVSNPGNDGFESWTARCRHNGCAHLTDRLVFLKALLERTPELWEAMEKEEYYG